MEGKNIYLSVFPEFLGLLRFCLLKLTKNIDLQVMRVTMMFRITRLSLSTGWNKKIRITLSTVASSVTVKRHILKAGLDPGPWTLDSGLWTFFPLKTLSPPPKKKPLSPPEKPLYLPHETPPSPL